MTTLVLEIRTQGRNIITVIKSAQRTGAPLKAFAAVMLFVSELGVKQCEQ